MRVNLSTLLEVTGLFAVNVAAWLADPLLGLAVSGAMSTALGFLLGGDDGTEP